MTRPARGAAGWRRRLPGAGGWHGLAGWHGPNRDATRWTDPHGLSRISLGAAAGAKPVAAQGNAGVSLDWHLEAGQADATAVAVKREHLDRMGRLARQGHEAATKHSDQCRPRSREGGAPHRHRRNPQHKVDPLKEAGHDVLLGRNRPASCRRPSDSGRLGPTAAIATGGRWSGRSAREDRLVETVSIGSGPAIPVPGRSLRPCRPSLLPPVPAG